jgi:UDP-N-acetylmuramoyl-tripeptide--D-alanyl-D-alanine ligase
VRGQRDGVDILFNNKTAGRHFAMNAMACLAVADALRADPDVAACDLGQWRAPAGRGTRETIVMDIVDDHLTFDLLDDAFNANPASMAGAIEVLAAAAPIDGLGRIYQGRRVAILGDMLELGAQEIALHVHCVGDRMRALYDVLAEHQRGEWHAQAGEMVARAHAIVDAGDVILVKGSKGSHVSRVVDAIRKLGHSQAPDIQGNE